LGGVYHVVLFDVIVGMDHGPDLRDQELDWHGRLLRFLDAGEEFIEERKLGDTSFSRAEILCVLD
jgi:hypothetical protein